VPQEQRTEPGQPEDHRQLDRHDPVGVARRGEDLRPRVGAWDREDVGDPVTEDDAADRDTYQREPAHDPSMSRHRGLRVSPPTDIGGCVTPLLSRLVTGAGKG
jgi:hypothetical protein